MSTPPAAASSASYRSPADASSASPGSGPCTRSARDPERIGELAGDRRAIAPRMAGRQPDVLVEREAPHVVVRRTGAGPVAADQLAVGEQGRRPGREAEHGLGAGAHRDLDRLRREDGDVVGGLERDDLHQLMLSCRTRRSCLGAREQSRRRVPRPGRRSGPAAPGPTGPSDRRNGDVVGLLRERVRDGHPQPLADLGDAAAEDDVLGVDGEADQSDRVGDPRREPVPDLHRAGIAGRGRVEERLRRGDAGRPARPRRPRTPTPPSPGSRPGRTGTDGRSDRPGTWPISPAALRNPRRNRPSRIDAAARPVPRLR